MPALGAKIFAFETKKELHSAFFEWSEASLFFGCSAFEKQSLKTLGPPSEDPLCDRFKDLSKTRPEGQK